MDTGGQSYFMFALRYAFRNLWRNSRRTTLTIGTVLFSVSVAIIANRYSTAIMQLWQDAAADTGSAHAQLHAKGFWAQPEGVNRDLTIEQDTPYEKSIREDAGVEASVRRLRLEGIMSTGDDSLYFIGIGVEPQGELKVSPRLFTANDVGEFVGPGIHGVTVGKGMAESMKLKLGDEVTLITKTIDGSVNGIDAKVVGIVDAAIPSFSQRVIYAHVELFQKLIRMPNRYTELAVRLNKTTDAEKWVEARLPAAEAAGIDLKGWWDIEPIIRKVGRIWDSVVLVITFLLFVSTALSVSNIIYMMVAERTVEIGTLMAIGARPLDVSLLFSLEAILIGLFGGIAGMAVGTLAVFLMDVFGVPFDSPFGSDQLIVHPKISLGLALVVFAFGIIICQISALAPSRKASRVEPVRAFRGQIT